MNKKCDCICLVHGLKMSEHDCLFCCLCFTNLTPETCNVREDGTKENICVLCAKKEREHMERLRRLDKEDERLQS